MSIFPVVTTLIVFFFAIAFGLRAYRRRMDATAGQPTTALECRAGAVRYRRGDDERTVLLEDLQSVRIITTDEGPFVEDVFWVLIPHAGEPVVIPSGESGTQDLLELVGTLDGFDHRAVIAAMGSVEHAEFVCWEATID
ncbi:MAG: hypothetical protein AAFQ82_20225, partial [Myxococcota bacterium]